MNGSKTIEKRINRDLDRTMKDLTILRDDAVTGLNYRIGQIAEQPKRKAVSAVKSLNKSIGYGLNQYNSKIQGAVAKIPGDLSKKASRYPWVAVSMSLAIGLLLGSILRSGRHNIQ